jgi:hypothetical protein
MLLIKGKDEFESKDDYLTIRRTESVVTGSTIQDLENANTIH